MSTHRTQFEQAQAHSRQGRYREALQQLRSLLNHTHIIDMDYQDWLTWTAETYEKMNDPLAAAYVYLALGYTQDNSATAPMRRCLDRVDAPLVKARALEHQKRYSEAARIYLQQNKYAHAAVNHEQAKEYGPARAAWETLLSRQVLNQNGYLLALAYLNLSLCCLRLNDKKAHHEHLVTTTRLLEESADEYENKGDRENAFYCYQVLLKLGREVDSYENIAEGYLNSIRVLKGDNLKNYVLQYYEDFQRLSMEREEFHAAATLYREAAEYCSRLGLQYARYYESKSGDAWYKVAEANEKKGGPPELSENALCAAIDAFNQVGDLVKVREAHERLAALDLGEKKKKRYEDLLRRYQNIREEPIALTKFPEPKQTASTALWYVDLVEWEQDGDPLEVALSMVWDNVSYHDVARRKALKLILSIHDATRNSGGGPPSIPELGKIAEGLGEIGVYAVLSPLEKLANHPESSVRVKAVGAAKQLYFKRSFNLVKKGLADAPEVKEQALYALLDLHFPHAFEPLSRIYRENEDRAIRKNVIKSVGRIQNEDAAEFLLEILRYESDDLRNTAAEALRHSDNKKLPELIEKQLSLESGENRRLLQDILDHIRAGRRNLFS